MYILVKKKKYNSKYKFDNEDNIKCRFHYSIKQRAYNAARYTE